MSPAFNYVRNQYILGKFTNDDLVVLVSRNVITDDERLKIINGDY